MMRKKKMKNEKQEFEERQVQAEPEGWKLVPTVPTKEMVKAGNKRTWPLPSADVYRAMLAAAPAHPKPAAPATADDELPVGIAKPLRDILDDLPITDVMKSNAFDAILSLRSGASAQPAEPDPFKRKDGETASDYLKRQHKESGQ